MKYRRNGCRSSRNFVYFRQKPSITSRFLKRTNEVLLCVAFCRSPIQMALEEMAALQFVSKSLEPGRNSARLFWHGSFCGSSKRFVMHVCVLTSIPLPNRNTICKTLLHTFWPLENIPATSQYGHMFLLSLLLSTAHVNEHLTCS